jgi:hypothetical protein
MVLTAKNPKRVRLFKTTPSEIPIAAKPAEMKNPSVAANRYFAINASAVFQNSGPLYKGNRLLLGREL